MKKRPLDPTPYERDPQSRRIQVGIPDGTYVYVLSTKGEIWVLSDRPHAHPKVLGSAKPARYAGDLTVREARIQDVTNLSGTFQFDDQEGLLEVAETLKSIGFVLDPGAVRFFPTDGSRPRILA
jgi:hypothetical protein